MRRVCVAVFWAVLIALAIVGAYLALIYRPEPLAEGTPATGGARAVAGPAGGERTSAADVVEVLRRAQEIEAARALRSTTPTEGGPMPRDLRRLEHQRAAAEPVARRFFSVFARYELGNLDARIEAELRATATPAFFRALIAAPPRLPVAAGRPARAKLGALLFVADEIAAGGQPRAAELVGSLERAGQRSPIAIRLVEGQAGWRVAGIGR